MWNYLKDLFDPATFGSRRSSQWPRVRREHLEEHPYCIACGSRKKLRVHHLRPFHLFPELELDPGNLVTICQRKKYGINCHLLVGHRGNFRKINFDCVRDARYWYDKMNDNS